MHFPDSVLLVHPFDQIIKYSHMICRVFSSYFTIPSIVRVFRLNTGRSLSHGVTFSLRLESFEGQGVDILILLQCTHHFDLRRKRSLCFTGNHSLVLLLTFQVVVDTHELGLLVLVQDELVDLKDSDNDSQSQVLNG
jgi:hypothetical protein